MRHYTNTFRDYTTVIVEIEKTLPLHQLKYIEDILDALGQTSGFYSRPLRIINKHDEDIRIGHRFVVLCHCLPMTIEASIADIAEIVSTGSLIDCNGRDLLAYLKELEQEAA